MRINGLVQAANGGAVGRKKASRGDGDSFAAALDTDQTEAASPAHSPLPVTALGLLALQETPSASDGRSKGVARAEALLDDLNALRRSLLVGVVPAAQVQSLLAKVRDHQAVSDDPRLTALLAEIELRAAVELAKLGIFPSS